MTDSKERGGRTIVVGTAGHIDHGKTMLVRALTGIDTDRLPEEKRRGITVDLGFATCVVQNSRGEPVRLDLIDVPGHKQFVHNMLAGAGGIDLVMLVISAREGVMPQTEEHLAICELLGIRCGVVVLTKADLVSEEELSASRDRVRRALNSSFLREAPVVAVSAQSGFAVGRLREELARVSEMVPVRGTGGLPRLPVDRAFVMKGFGTVVTGTLHTGMLAVGQTLRIEPSGREVRVRGLQRQGCSYNEVFAGSRVALNLAGVEVAEVSRGSTLVVPGSMHVVQSVDAEVWLIEGAPELPHSARVRLHSFTSETVATVSVYGYGAVVEGRRQMVRLKLANPMLLLPGDRFVLRRLSPALTVGGGRVLDSHPLARTPKNRTLAWLERMKDASAGEQVRVRVERSGLTGMSVAQIAQQLGCAQDAVIQAVGPLLQGAFLQLLSGKLLISRDALLEAGENIVGVLGKCPAGNGSAAAVRKSELRSQSHLAPEVFEAALVQLARQQRVKVRGEPGGELVFAAGADADAPDPDRGRKMAVAEVYRSAALNPPAFAELLAQMHFSERDARAYVTVLLREKVLVKITAADVFMHREALGQLEKTIRELRGQTLDVGRFKQITGLSRKYSIPLLEYLDRRRITRREGETRIVL